MSNDNPFNEQVAGSHYRRMKLQPFQFSLRRGWDGAAHTILKYIARHQEKGGAADLEKADHVVRIRVAEMPRELFAAIPRSWAIPAPTMEEFIRVNEIEQPEAEALRLLEMWVDDPYRLQLPDELHMAIHDIIVRRYP